ncbi:MAG: hypothetical protein G3M78_01410 [Candidatus Nitrohelix vancouverensis]|uniref:Uncharacterized protein n=1 Tax=Candidatus Nitrohelix vancouverensis TaxID=2705534 RepID=A0A7T0G2A0_9BACT|nr:MAG: hypothetical protein G3M78_01410 [Candidatus Nitrohelix vancouverensis]
MFDVVLCIAVLYHLPDPYTALVNLASVTQGYAIIETVCDPDITPDVPTMRFDASHPGLWWRPNPACLKAMLLKAGFSRVELKVSNHEIIQATTLVYGDTSEACPLLLSPSEDAPEIIKIKERKEVMILGNEKGSSGGGQYYRVEIVGDENMRFQGWLRTEYVVRRPPFSLEGIVPRTRYIAKAYK